nr:xylanase [Butyrivibrio sp.]
ESREFLTKACDKNTGLSAEYSYFDGTPYPLEQDIFGRHDWFYSDAYRTIANIALDYEWFGKDTGYAEFERDICNKLQAFFGNLPDGNKRKAYLIDGTVLDEDALHPVAITATNAQASLAATGDEAKRCVQEFWNTPLRSGDRRYYDNCLYMFAMLALSGNYRIW